MFRKALLAAAALAAVAIPHAQADQVEGGGEGCIATTAPVPVVADGQQVVYSDSCSYEATRDGGYAGGGDWTITIENPDGSVVVITSTDPNGTSQGCTVWNAGAIVTAQTTNGTIGIGNPYPSAVDDLPETQPPCPPNG